MRSVIRSVSALVAVAFLSIAMVPAGAQAGEVICGDSTIDASEGCDDGGTASGDGCSDVCFVENGSACNFGPSGLQGDLSCESGLCDDTEDPPLCESTLTCGNGTLETGEGCDDGNTDANDGCSSACLVESGSACNFDANGLTGDQSCESGICDDTGSPTCEPALSCGNGVLESGEGCDDGANDAGDGCNASCLIEDGNSCNQDDNGFIGDGSCASGICDESENMCEPPFTCGNSVLDSNEGCDDGNVTADDGCSAACLIEDSYFCNQNEVGLFGDASCQSGFCNEAAETPICQQPLETTTSTSSTTTSTTSSTTSTSSTTTTTDTTTTSTLIPQGACCYSGVCSNETESACADLIGSYQGDGTSCTEPGICVNCGDGCVDFGETCDDANTFSEDGCSSGCQEEECYSCTIGQITGDTGGPVACIGPSTCELDGSCSVCGNGEVEVGEECDTGEVVTPCCDDCEYAVEGTACPDSTFCDGVEECDGAGNCFDTKGSEPTCDQLDGPCTEGLCDSKLDQCVAIPANEGEPCATNGDCIVGAGSCNDGVCSGTATVLSPTCRWIIVGGTSNTDNVRVRSGRGSTMDADQCGDRAKSAGITTADIIVTAPVDTEGVRFYGPPEVAGDIATGGGTVRANLYLDIPGTSLKFIDTGMIVDKPAPSVVDTTGAHPLVEVCRDDQDVLADAEPVLEAMGDPAMEEGTPNKGLKVAVGAGYTIDVTGDGVAVVDMDALKVGHGGNLTLTGLATDVIMIRINGGRLKFGYHSSLTLNGLLPENVLFYVNGGSRCRVSPGVVGAGTIFCPDAGRLIVGVGVDWQGTFLGAENEVQVRLGAVLTHVPFTGF